MPSIFKTLLEGFSPVKSPSPTTPPQRFGVGDVLRGAVTGGTGISLPGERPGDYLKDVGKGLLDYYTPPPATGDYLKDLGSFVKHVIVRGGQSFISPATTTVGFAQQFAKDVVAPGSPGSMSARLETLKGTYGPGTGTAAFVGEAGAKTAATVATGIAAGKLYQSAKDLGLAGQAGFVRPIWRNNIDKGASTEQLAKDHAAYHSTNLGYGNERAHISGYHDDLTYELARRFKLKQPVLDEDFNAIFEKLAKDYPDEMTGFPARPSKTPLEKTVESQPPIGKQTPAEREGIYRWKAGREFTPNDQWKAYQKGVIEDLRRVNESQNVIDQVKAMDRGGVERDLFARRLTANTNLSPSGKLVAEAWQGEIDSAYKIHSALKTGKPTPKNLPSPVSELNQRFTSTTEIPPANAQAAKLLRETASYYERQGTDIAARKIPAYNRAADLLEGAGAPDIAGMTAEELVEAFKGQGGFGKYISSHVEEIIYSGTFPELEALRKIFGVGVAARTLPGGPASGGLLQTAKEGLGLFLRDVGKGFGPKAR